MELTKTASDVVLRKVAAADAVDQANAVDLGFARACGEMGLNREQTQKLAGVAKDRLQKFAAEQGLPSGEHQEAGNPDKNTPEGEGQGETVSAGHDNKGSGNHMNTGSLHGQADSNGTRVGATSGAAATPAGK